MTIDELKNYIAENIYNRANDDQEKISGELLQDILNTMVEVLSTQGLPGPRGIQGPKGDMGIPGVQFKDLVDIVRVAPNDLMVINDANDLENNKPKPKKVTAIEVSPFEQGVGTGSSQPRGGNCEANSSHSHAEGSNTKAGSPIFECKDGYQGDWLSFESDEEVRKYFLPGKIIRNEEETYVAEITGINGNTLYVNVIIDKLSTYAGAKMFVEANNSHAEGNNSRALGESSHAEGGSKNMRFNKSPLVNAENTESSIYLLKNPVTDYYVQNGNKIRSSDEKYEEGFIDIIDEDDKYLIRFGGPVDDDDLFNYNQYYIIGNYLNKGVIDENEHPHIASGDFSHAEGLQNMASGKFSHAEGIETRAEGLASHAEGGTIDPINNPHKAEGNYSHVEGSQNIATGESSHAEGTGTTASGKSSHAEGFGTTASGYGSHAEGIRVQAIGRYSHAEGISTITGDINDDMKGLAAHAEGYMTTAIGLRSHAEGYKTTASGDASHAEGYFTKCEPLVFDCIIQDNVISVRGDQDILEYLLKKDKKIKIVSKDTTVKIIDISNGNYMRFDITINKDFGPTSFDDYFYVIGSASISAHSEGYKTIASGDASHAEGLHTVAQHENSHIMGKYGHTTEANSWFLANGSSDEHDLAAKITPDGMYHEQNIYEELADYAEMFEWEDGNTNKEDRVGHFVTLKDNKIIKAKAEDSYLLGIVSATPGVVGDAGALKWKDKYKKDEWGRDIYEEVTLPAETEERTIPAKMGTNDIGEPIELEPEKTETVTVLPERKEMQRVLNPEYDPKKGYIAREDRPEWDPVGMMGKLRVRDDGTCEVNGYCRPNDEGIATKSDKGFRVMERINDHIVLVLFVPLPPEYFSSEK